MAAALRHECEQLARKLKVGRTPPPPGGSGGADLYADVPWDEGLDLLEAFATRIQSDALRGRCRCGVVSEVSHYCSALGHAWVGRRAIVKGCPDHWDDPYPGGCPDCADEAAR
jgi:hypothetical protein